MIQDVIGPAGQAHRVDVPDHILALNPDNATVGIWLLRTHMDYFPLSGEYAFSLGCVHLRDVPNQTKRPTRKWPNATHEVVVSVLEPATAPATPWEYIGQVAGGGPRMARLALVHQCRDATDWQMQRVLAMAATTVATGQLDPAAPERHHRDLWHTYIEEALERVKL